LGRLRKIENERGSTGGREKEDKGQRPWFSLLWGQQGWGMKKTGKRWVTEGKKRKSNGRRVCERGRKKDKKQSKKQRKAGKDGDVTRRID